MNVFDPGRSAMYDPAVLARDLMLNAQRLTLDGGIYVTRERAAMLETDLLRAFRLLMEGEFSTDMALLLLWPFVHGLERRRSESSDNERYIELIKYVKMIGGGEETWGV